MAKNASERATASEPRERSGDAGAPARERVQGSAGAKPPGTIKVTQIRSGIGFDRKQSLALKGLGLRRLRHTVDVVDTPSTRGLILKVRHLVTVDEGSAK